MIMRGLVLEIQADDAQRRIDLFWVMRVHEFLRVPRCRSPGHIQGQWTRFDGAQPVVLRVGATSQDSSVN